MGFLAEELIKVKLKVTHLPQPYRPCNSFELQDAWLLLRISSGGHPPILCDGDVTLRFYQAALDDLDLTRLRSP